MWNVSVEVLQIPIGYWLVITVEMDNMTKYPMAWATFEYLNLTIIMLLIIVFIYSEAKQIVCSISQAQTLSCSFFQKEVGLSALQQHLTFSKACFEKMKCCFT